MKIELDTTNKTITIKSDYKINDLEKIVDDLGLDDWTILIGKETVIANYFNPHYYLTKDTGSTFDPPFIVTCSINSNLD